MATEIFALPLPDFRNKYELYCLLQKTHTLSLKKYYNMFIKINELFYRNVRTSILDQICTTFSFHGGQQNVFRMLTSGTGIQPPFHMCFLVFLATVLQQQPASDSKCNLQSLQLTLKIRSGFQCGPKITPTIVLVLEILSTNIKHAGGCIYFGHIRYIFRSAC